MNENDFKLTKGFKSYVSKAEITDLAPNYLVKGSRNVLIDYANRIISRPGYTLYNQANNGGGGIKSGYDWITSNGIFYDIRVYDGKMEFDWKGAYNSLISGLKTSNVMFEKVWDATEGIDVMIFVTGETQFYKWSGGATEVSSSTATTLKKRGVLTAQTTIGFVSGSPATITDSGNRFLTEGFAAGDRVYIEGSVSNNKVFTIASVTAGVITLISSDVLITEAAGASVTIHNGSPTWATSRFLTAGTRKILYGGVEYAYTGGETTDTLTGLTAFPAVTAGDKVWQTVIAIANPSGIPSTYKSDYIGVQFNQLILGSSTSLDIYGSSTTDYTDFTLTTPRAPADPFKVTLDNYCTCIEPYDNSEHTNTYLIIGAGKNTFFKFVFIMAQDNSSEIVRVSKLKTAIGSGLISRNAITNIKNASAYISNEPSFELLGAIENQEGTKNVPISDIIKDDFDAYNFTGCDVEYWKRAAWVALPAEGIVLIYDFMRGLWQPPQTISIGKWTIIDGWLHGHSSVVNETYRMFDGTNDNGIFIHQIARFAYNNGGRRDRIKIMSEYWTDGYITPNGELTMTQYLGFNGSKGRKTMNISGADPDITTQLDGSPLGDDTLGSNPLGGSTLSPVQYLPGTESVFLRFYQDDTMEQIDYTESFVEYSMTTLDGQFAIVAHGNNQHDAGTSLNKNMK